MTKKIVLNAKERTSEDVSAKKLRLSGRVPGIVYGPGIDNQKISLDQIELSKAYEKAGESTLIDLKIGDKASHKVIIKDTQFGGMRQEISHVDFIQVNMKMPIEVEVPFVLVGTAPAEEIKQAMIINNAESLMVRCLPSDLLDNIEIDLTKLVEIGDSVRVSDLVLPEGIEILSPLDEVIVIASEHEVEAEPEAVVAEVPIAEPAKDASKKDATK
jgi:large subunit ribosomal protein L25